VQGLVYGVEPTGDVTYLTVMAGSKQVEVKAARDYRSDIDVAIGIGFDPARLYFFGEDGERIRGAA
jgi:multiple sugar transport system ATP-binding protein